MGERGGEEDLLRAVRERCLVCRGDFADPAQEVRRCGQTACPLWPFRMGTDPWRDEK